MFSIPRLNVIASDAGFSIEMLGRTGIKYREEDRTLPVQAEILMTEAPSVAIWKDWIKKWNPPYDKEPISEGKREEIIANISAALRWRSVEPKIL